MFPLSKSIESLFRARLLPILAACALLALLVVIATVATITWLTDTFVQFDRHWLDSLVTWIAGIISGVGGWFMLPVLTVLLGGIFQETVIQRVEKVYYPDRVRQGEPGLWPDLRHDLLFTLRALGLNLLLIPFYFFGIGPLLSIALNSYLLGREFFEAAAGHHLGKPAARQLGRLHRKTVYGGGLIITGLTLVPFINLTVPVLATAWMVHVYHGLTIKRDARSR